jgi:hypothetical protein
MAYNAYRLTFHVCITCILCFGISQHTLLWVSSSLYYTSEEFDHSIQPTRIYNESAMSVGHIPNQSNPNQHAGATRRVVYSRLRTDQSGWAIMDMLKAHSYTFYNDATYGGACGDTAHKADLDQVLGTVGLQNVLPLKCPGANESNTVVHHGHFFEGGSKARLESPQWINHIKAQLHYPPSSDKFIIAVHIRRRDVTPCCYPRWYMPNLYFQTMIEKYTAGRPTNSTRVIIFSQSNSFESLNTFRESGFELDLDGDVGRVWRTIIGSDIVIVSRSEFSRVPSMFTRGHVESAWNISDPVIAKTIEQEQARIFGQCTERQIFQCKHKWWQKH